MNRFLLTGMCLVSCLAGQSLAEQPASRPENRVSTAVLKTTSPVRVAMLQPPAPDPTMSDDGEPVRRPSPSTFSYPPGLSMSAEVLFRRLGYIPADCLPMTSDTTYDVAFACFIRGMYSDAIAFTDRGLAIREDARLYLLKGVCEMNAGLCIEAEATADKYLQLLRMNKNLYGLAATRERVNGPMRVRFEQILKHITAMTAG
jgi:hypothetical protein